MQSAKDFLVAEADKKLAEATHISDAAAKAARSLDADERREVERLISETTHLKSRIQDIDDNEKIREQIENMRGPANEPATPAGPGKSLGDAFVKSNAYEALKNGFKSGAMTGNWSSGPVELADFGRKATLDTGDYPSQPSVQPGIRATAGTELRRLTIADLLATGTTDSATIRYLQESTVTNGADTVAEGALKPESEFVFAQVDEPVRKVATFLPVSDEMLEDEAQIRSYLDNRLGLFVQHEEEAQILNGNGTAPNVRGLLQRTGVQTTAVASPGAGVTNPSGPDYIFDAITNIRTNALVEPDGVVIHPTNWAAVRKAKDENGQYYGGGPFTGQYGNGGIAGEELWGLRIVTTTAIPVNTVLVGAFATMAQVFYRNGLTVEASNSHADFFQRNQTAIRAERRLALAVYRPESFHTITGFDNAGVTGTA